MPFRLIPVGGPDRDGVSLRVGAARLGSGPDNDIVIRDPQAAHRHAGIEVRGGRVFLVDLAGRGTFVNGVGVTDEMELALGDVIAIGAWKRRLVREGEGQETARFIVVESNQWRTLRQDSLTVGRRNTADIVLRDPRVAPLHATIAFDQGAFRIRCAGRTQGAFVNGRRIVSATLSSGDEVVFGLKPDSPGVTTESTSGVDRHVREPAEASRMDVRVEDGVCTLTVAAAGPPAPLQSRRRSRDKARRWIPTSDVSPNRLRFWLTLGLLLLSMAACVWSLSARSPDPLMPGDLRPAHRSDKYLKAAGSDASCAACHTEWRGVAAAACLDCHAVETPQPHKGLALRCWQCHGEHGREAPDQAGPAQYRCLACHPRAHGAIQTAGGGTQDIVFVNRRFQKAFIHGVHRGRECSTCHAMKEGGKAGPVTTSCDRCHGAASGMGDARCLTCHRYHAARADAPGSHGAPPFGTG